ncbi:hypothetical protein AVEN_38251-1 [Araneus ventricosus]|uniref:Uncharacterized protein n=1 Tax=Araneus ventricosus TaxID=182803 RepID=A0A4Y2KEH4_ARAVE|nr:hypothetical protein AVEN_38251-1 [Araneus ventricosus]
MMTIYDIPDILATALPQATTENSKTANFAMAGISNKNPGVFPNSEFLRRCEMDHPQATSYRPQIDSTSLDYFCSSRMSTDAYLTSATERERNDSQLQ